MKFLDKLASGCREALVKPKKSVLNPFALLAIVLAVIHTLATAAPKDSDRVLELYRNKQYERACMEGSRVARDYKYDETLLSAYGISCIESDFIDLASFAGANLRATPESRQNANYILTVMFQKKLLYQAMLDGVDLGDTHLPETPHILSRVFTAYAAGKYDKQKDGSLLLYMSGGETALLDLIHEGGHFKVRIRPLDATGALAGRAHLYW
jgi:hypothetical protein